MTDLTERRLTSDELAALFATRRALEGARATVEAAEALLTVLDVPHSVIDAYASAGTALGRDHTVAGIQGVQALVEATINDGREDGGPEREHWSTRGLAEGEIRIAFERIMSRVAGDSFAEVVDELRARLAEAREQGWLEEEPPAS